jgi:hypothetical protein
VPIKEIIQLNDNTYRIIKKPLSNRGGTLKTEYLWFDIDLHLHIAINETHVSAVLRIAKDLSWFTEIDLTRGCE